MPLAARPVVVPPCRPRSVARLVVATMLASAAIAGPAQARVDSLRPVADTQVAPHSTKQLGAARVLRVAGPRQMVYLRFRVGRIPGAMDRAQLRVFARPHAKTQLLVRKVRRERKW